MKEELCEVCGVELPHKKVSMERLWEAQIEINKLFSKLPLTIIQ